MSVRRAAPAVRAAPPTPVGARQRDSQSRLQFVLSAGHAPRSLQTPYYTSMDTPMDTSEPPAASPRKIMMLKGIVFGIPKDQYKEAFEAAYNLIMTHGITTICWDGDKYTYPSIEDGIIMDPAGSFSRLIVRLKEELPYLELIFFKTEGNATELLSDVGMMEPDKFGNMLGPFPFMTTENTPIYKSTDPAPLYKPYGIYGIEFPPPLEWFELGLKGLEYIKEELGVTSVVYMIFGKGGAVKKELKELAKNPAKYPTGVAEKEVIEIYVDTSKRPTKTA